MGHWTYVVLGGIIAAFSVISVSTMIFFERRKQRGK